MYLVNKTGIVDYIKIKTNIQTKNTTLKKKKQSIVFVRAPKHFNIGKHKIHQLNIKNLDTIYLNKSSRVDLLSKKFNLLSVVNNIYTTNYLHNIFSAKIKLTYSIKFCDKYFNFIFSIKCLFFFFNFLIINNFI